MRPSIASFRVGDDGEEPMRNTISTAAIFLAFTAIVAFPAVTWAAADLSILDSYDGWLLGGAALLAISILSGSTFFLFKDPVNMQPSFFFSLGTIYTGLLLLMAAIYQWRVPLESKPYLLNGILPIAVPWFGALGAVTISLEGVFLWNQQWKRRFNYWHIARPLFGAVLGI